MEVKQQFGDDVRIIGVPGLAGIESIENFVADNGVDDIDHIADSNGELWDRFGVQGHRTYVIVNDDGTTRTTSYGSLPEEAADLIAR